MKNQMKLMSKSSWGLAVIALGVVLTLSLTPQLVNAQSVAESTFNSPLPGGEGPAHDHPEQGANPRDLLDGIVDRDAILADVLGITVEELQTARENGTSVHELVEELGLDPETVHQELDTAKAEAVQQAVEDGVLTAEEAAAILNPPARRGPEADPNADADENAERPNRGPRANRPAPPSDESPADASADPNADTNADENVNPAAADENRQDGGAPRGGDSNVQNNHPAENGPANGQGGPGGNRPGNQRRGR
ncbi:MAG: hypothetical protein R2911_25565 [Caldilineaceae bacterium]